MIIIMIIIMILRITIMIILTGRPCERDALRSKRAEAVDPLRGSSVGIELI